MHNVRTIVRAACMGSNTCETRQLNLPLAQTITSHVYRPSAVCLFSSLGKEKCTKFDFNRRFFFY
jgi:hypothetical protein